MTARSHLAQAAAWAAAAALAGCIPSNVVARADRLVDTAVADLRFEPAGTAPITGLWASVQLTGDAALSLRKVYYVFLANGAYTAAALLEEDGRLAFQTLSGTYAVGDAGLVLDDAAPATLERAPDHLRISTPAGALVLRRERTS